MDTCPECGAENVIVYSCECCGNYACCECDEVIPHCKGCSCSMTDTEEKDR